MNNIKIQSFDGSSYSQLLPQNSASLTTYSNTKTGISATTVQDAIDSCFTSVSNRKILIASAITDRGISTGANDSFSTMANNILKLNNIHYSTEYSFDEYNSCYQPTAPTHNKTIDKIVLAQLSVYDRNHSVSFILLNTATGYWESPPYMSRSVKFPYNQSGLIESKNMWTEYPRGWTGVLIYKD